jgi:CRP-like cAMP-binding protein
VVIAEGDPADDLYVVESGRYAVSANRVGIRVMGPDSWFGEIGLLRGIPRTATVVAETDGVLLSINGQAFLDAVADPGPSDPVRRLMTARLAQTHPSLVGGQYDSPAENEFRARDRSSGGGGAGP